MRVGRIIGQLVVASALALMTSSSFAAELSPLPAQGIAPAPSGSAAKQKIGDLPRAGARRVNRGQLQADALHNDPRWWQFQNCIDNTGTREAFEACLQQAYASDQTAANSVPPSK